jgi:hypothetical protein
MSKLVIPTEPEVTIDTARRRALSEAEARELTTVIRRSMTRLWILVTEAHDRRAHAAMGYDTWDAYVRAELRMSPSRSYQLLDQGHVMRAMAQGGADPEALEPPPTRVVAKVKDRLPEVAKVARAAVRDGTDPDKAVRALARTAVSVSQDVVIRGEVTPPVRVQPELVVCPVCVGEGKVSRSLARRAQSWMSRRRK